MVQDVECVKDGGEDKLFKFIFDMITEPLGLPIEWYQEWFLLGIIEAISYELAFSKVGMLYRSGMRGRVSGSFMYNLLKAGYFVLIWMIVRGIIIAVDFGTEHKLITYIVVLLVLSGIAIVKIIKHRDQEKRLNNHLRELNLK